MVDLNKPPLADPNEPLRILKPSSRETAAAVPVTRVRDLMARPEGLIDERKISGRLLKFTPTETYRLDQALFLHKGAVMELPAGRACVVFQQTRYGVQARGFYALTDSRISGPAAYLDVEAPDVSALCLEGIEAGDTPLDGGFTETALASGALTMLFCAPVIASARFIDDLYLTLTLCGVLSVLAGYIQAKRAANVWRRRGEDAKIKIRSRVETDVELFLPDVIEHATAPLEDSE